MKAQNPSIKKKKSLKIIQTKLFLFDGKKKLIEPSEIEKVINDWCWKHDIVNDEDTAISWEMGEGYVFVNLCYSKVKSFSPP